MVLPGNNIKRQITPTVVFEIDPLNRFSTRTGRPGSSEVPRNPLTRWDVSSILANGMFLTKKQTN